MTDEPRFIGYAGPRTWRIGYLTDIVDWARDLGYPVTFFRQVDIAVPCEGLTASWCPNCGDCCCNREKGLDHPDCPLHAPGTPHPYAHMMR